MYDFCIIGGGVIGCAVARELTRYKADIVLVEAALDVCTGASGANSAIVHSGYDPEPGTLMAKYNKLGSRMFRAYSAALGVPYKQTGSLTVATTDGECETLRALLERGKQNGIKDLRIIGREEALALVPSLADGVIAALYAPTAAITDPFDLTFALRENAQANGAEFKFGFDVCGATFFDDGVAITSSAGETVKAKKVINCAGGRAGEVARILGELIYLTHRAGEYLLFDVVPFVGMPVFQTPTEKGKGVLVAPTTSGNFFIGPTAIDCAKSEAPIRREAFAELAAAAEKSVKNVPHAKRITSFTGVRALSQTGDFVIGESRVNPAVFNVIGIGSPGLTAAPAIATAVAKGFGLEPRSDFDPMRRPMKRIFGRSANELNALIATDPAFGNIVCMCNTVSEAEVVEAIRRGARTVDGVKKRTGTGMGRCQGGFCESRVLEILARELNVGQSELVRKHMGSNCLGEDV